MFNMSDLGCYPIWKFYFKKAVVHMMRESILLIHDKYWNIIIFFLIRFLEFLCFIPSFVIIQMKDKNNNCEIYDSFNKPSRKYSFS